ncbi:MAG: hypothetical protein V4494_00950 [Chlamydiota bacterium]
MSTKGISLGSLQLHEKKQTPVQNKTNKPASWDPFRWSVTKLCTTNAQDSKVKNFFGKILATICTAGLSCTIVGIPLLGRAYVIMKEEQAFESGKTEGTKTPKKGKHKSKGKDKSDKSDKSKKSKKSSKKHKKEINALNAEVTRLTTQNTTLTTEKNTLTIEKNVLVEQQAANFDYKPLVTKFLNNSLDQNDTFEAKINTLFFSIWQCGLSYERTNPNQIQFNA